MHKNRLAARDRGNGDAFPLFPVAILAVEFLVLDRLAVCIRHFAELHRMRRLETQVYFARPLVDEFENNLAVMGLAKVSRDRRKIIVSSTEHLSVKFPAERLQEQGFNLVEIPVDEDGFISLDKLSEQVDRETLMVTSRQ